MKMQITIIRKAAGSLCFGLTAAVMMAANSVSAETADYVFKNGAIYTMDGQNPKAQAIAVSGKHIAYVGNNDGAQAFIGDKTKVTDLKGQMLLPGFVEAHIHPNLAFFTKGADLQCDTVEELLASSKDIRRMHIRMPRSFRALAGATILFPTTGPNKADLDKLFPDRPVLLVAIDCHSAWVNSKALELAGINAKTPDPVPGVSYFQRDPKTGEPTGWVVETAAEQDGPGQAESAHSGGPEGGDGRATAEVRRGGHYGGI